MRLAGGENHSVKTNVFQSFNCGAKTRQSKAIKLKSFITDVNGWAKGESRSDPGRTRDVISSIGMWMLSQTKKNIEKERLGLAIEVLLKVKGSMLERVNFVTKKDNAESKSEETQGNEVHLMTMHGSKGLEFDYVWIIAAEHTVIPSEASVVVSEETMNEERRLMYVAMTRAKDVLYISSTAEHSISIFLKEAKLIK